MVSDRESVRVGLMRDVCLRARSFLEHIDLIGTNPTRSLEKSRRQEAERQLRKSIAMLDLCVDLFDLPSHLPELHIPQLNMVAHFCQQDVG